MSTVKQRIMSALFPGPGGGSNDPTGPHPEWLCAVATDGNEVRITYPDTLNVKYRDDTNMVVNGVFNGMKKAKISYEDDPERYLAEMTRHPMGGSTDTEDYATFEEAQQAALQKFQTPVNEGKSTLVAARNVPDVLSTDPEEPHDLQLTGKGAMNPAPNTETIEDDPGPEVPWGSVDPTERHVFEPLSLVNPWDCSYCFGPEGALLHTQDMREQVIANYGDPSDELAAYDAHFAEFDGESIGSVRAKQDATELRDVVLPGGREYLTVALAAHLAHALKDRLTRTLGLAPYYVQWAPGGPGLQVEVVSDRYLAPEYQITAFGEARMRELGFAEPTDEKPNWTALLANEFESVAVAEPLVTALLDVYRLPMPEVIVAVGPFPEPALAPTAALSSIANDSSSAARDSEQRPESTELDESEAHVDSADFAKAAWPIDRVYLIGERDPESASRVKNVWARFAVRYFEDPAIQPLVEWFPEHVTGAYGENPDVLPFTRADIQIVEYGRHKVGTDIALTILAERVAMGEHYALTQAEVRRVIRRRLDPKSHLHVVEDPRSVPFDTWVSEQLERRERQIAALIAESQGSAAAPGDDSPASGSGARSATTPILTRPEPGESREEFKLRVAAALGVKPSQTLRGSTVASADVAEPDSEDSPISAPSLAGADDTESERSDGRDAMARTEQLRELAWQVQRRLDDLVVDVDGWWEPWVDERRRGVEGIRLVQAPGRALATEITVSSTPWRMEITTDLGEFLVHDEDLDELIPLDTRLVSVFVIPDTENNDREEGDPWRRHLGARCRIDLDAVQRSVPLRLLVDLTRRTSVTVLLKMQELCQRPGAPIWFGAPAAPDRTALASWLTLPWSPDVDLGTRASFASAFDDAGFGVPWLPELFAQSVELTGESWWSAHEAAETAILSRVDAYTFAPALARLALDWSPRFHLSHFHGSINYEFVGRRLSALAQSWTGTYGRDPDDSTAGIRLLAADLSVLERLTDAIEEWPSERGRLLVWGSSFRDVCGWRWLFKPQQFTDRWREGEDREGDDLGTGLGAAIRMLEAKLADELGLTNLASFSSEEVSSSANRSEGESKTSEPRDSNLTPVSLDNPQAVSMDLGTVCQLLVAFGRIGSIATESGDGDLAQCAAAAIQSLSLATEKAVPAGRRWIPVAPHSTDHVIVALDQEAYFAALRTLGQGYALAESSDRRPTQNRREDLDLLGFAGGYPTLPPPALLPEPDGLDAVHRFGLPRVEVSGSGHTLHLTLASPYIDRVMERVGPFLLSHQPDAARLAHGTERGHAPGHDYRLLRVAWSDPEAGGPTLLIPLCVICHNAVFSNLESLDQVSINGPWPGEVVTTLMAENTDHVEDERPSDETIGSQ